MTLTINGERQELPPCDTLAAVLAQLDYLPEGVAVALNGEFVPRTARADTRVEDGDDLEIVAPLQGG